MASFSIGVYSIDEHEIKALGSGTLVQYNDIFGVLTARHVVELFQNYDSIGLVLHKREHRFLIETRHLDLIASETGITEESGPDIAFVRLPKSKVGTIKATCSFVNLGVNKEKVLNSLYVHDKGLWCLFGFPEEMRSIHEDGKNISVDFFGRCSVGGAPNKYSDEGKYDYFWQRIVYSRNNNPPQSYGGVSGGGLWQATIVPKDGAYEVSEYIFRGVAFYQTNIEENARHIKCHGERSVYFFMLDQIEKRYS